MRVLKTITLLFTIGLLSNNTFAQKVYSLDAAYKADKKIYFVDADYKADIKIYFIDSDYKTKWNKSDKKHKMY